MHEMIGYLKDVLRHGMRHEYQPQKVHSCCHNSTLVQRAKHATRITCHSCSVGKEVKAPVSLSCQGLPV